MSFVRSADRKFQIPITSMLFAFLCTYVHIQTLDSWQENKIMNTDMMRFSKQDIVMKEKHSEHYV